MEAIDSRLQEQFRSAQVLHREGKIESARELYARIIDTMPDHFEALNSLGVIAGQMRDLPQALHYFERAIAVQPRNSAPYCNRGLAFRQLRQLGPALASFDQAIALDGHSPISLFGRAETHRDLGQREHALEDYDKAVALDPAFAQAWFRRGLLLQEMGQLREAVASHDHAIFNKPDHIEAHANRAFSLSKLHDHLSALSGYDNIIAMAPNQAPIHLLRSDVLRELNRREDAEQACARAIAINPMFAEAYANRAILLLELDRPEDALLSYDRAISIKPDYAEAYFNRAYLLRRMNRYEAAAADYRLAGELSQELEFLHGAHLETLLQVCDWTEFDTLMAQIVTGLETSKRVTHPFNVLGLIDEPQLQLRAAEIWVNHSGAANTSLGVISTRPRPTKLRIGYFSADYREHPTARLVAELIETHDRSRFEIIGFAFGPETMDESRKRLERAFDHFIDISSKSDLDAACLARSMNVDIGVDLGGHTHDSRTGIFALRAAPVQVNYLGYLGTMGADYMDYIVADRTVITAETEAYFTEKIIYLPDTFQVNDRKREMSSRLFGRAELGLPARGFVFCCFNSTYKILPATFGLWMRILTRVPDSVLMLVGGSETLESNLRTQAAHHGVNPGRLVFAERLPPPEYLARYRAADLFLDTLPYNAGATASDALWAGLPVLTCVGKAFAGRVAASLLKAIDLPELITSSAEEYEQLAVALATDPVRLTGLKKRLEQNRLTSPLFDTHRFTRALEKAYARVHERYHRGLAPDHIAV
jgi:predicted O-linked N-acetylglucosamine transferase (SPINDLY family)